MLQLKVLIVPSVEKGQGGGHLARSIRLSQELRSLGQESWVYLEDKDLGIEGEFIVTDERDGAWDVVILDQFRTPNAEFTRWRKIAPIIGLDEGGKRRKNFDFLIDILPNLEKHKPNIANLSFLFSNTHDSLAVSEERSVAVAFGAEDAAGLTTPVSIALLQAGFVVTAVFGALNQTSTAEREKLRKIGAEIWENVENLGERLGKFSLIITHYGLTAFESLRTRTSVILVSPTRYHERLARKAGFLTIRKVGELRSIPIHKIIDNNRTLAERYRIDETESLGVFLAHIEIHSADCPLCGPNPQIVPHTLVRFSDSTYRKCPVCRTVFMSRLIAPPIEYNRGYFFDSYKKQYGKTYLEDFPNLVEIGRKRLVHIKNILRSRGGEAPRLLDVGCAYGPFLVAAAEAGFAPAGLEAAEDAADYVENILQIPCYNAAFPTPLTERFDIISLWFVIEHFEKTGEVFAEINRLLKPNGILAFSTPSFAGISARKSQKEFLKNSPADHYLVLDPRNIRVILKRFGFSVRKIVITGIHPERFPFFGQFAHKNPLLNTLLSLSSRLFRLGDTFEVYAVKKGGNR
ncbi:MAG: class I SAM-dependent methyltransferase [Treponema sp.]|jgi:2-polyprenyl-3-methyl-5-hydroxy-6-metoxy-1,4-benzoquinol methylase/spore coat polysaccharide biosynthesis predicted glycosyltransferase SpsG|nr:class I SAM-dependent methyltransferase [Treponema sp.]